MQQRETNHTVPRSTRLRSVRLRLHFSGEDRSERKAFDDQLTTAAESSERDPGREDVSPRAG